MRPSAPFVVMYLTDVMAPSVIAQGLQKIALNIVSGPTLSLDIWWELSHVRLMPAYDVTDEVRRDLLLTVTLSRESGNISLIPILEALTNHYVSRK
jgi:hypothetical protein